MNISAKHTVSFYALALGIVFIAFPFFASAHVGLGMYAGTHAVSFVPEPHHSPFVGEEITLNFYMKDLRGYVPIEPFIVSVLVQRVVEDGDEIDVAALIPKKIKDGLYQTTYRFEKEGLYRIEFGFGKPDEPDVIREAIFEIEARNSGYPPSKEILSIIALLGVAIFSAGVLFEKYIQERKVFE